MKKRSGFTLVEVAVVALIFTLLLYSAVNFLRTSSSMFTRQEESMTLLSEASRLVTKIRQDLEFCINPAEPVATFNNGKGALQYRDGVFQFSVLENSKPVRIQYSLNGQKRQLERSCNGEVIYFGRGYVTGFTVVHHMMTADGVLRSFPGDPQSTFAEPMVPDPAPVAIKSWAKLILTMESPKASNIPIKKEYTIRFFPIRLNRQLQTLWEKTQTTEKKTE